ncbi:N-acetylmuramoyl-L-alanine amidase [Blastococcus deserti]|uniref:N-acetylmuramoyl-L-alanine amidase n=1 Tax=Blastococcus deserti TaxID=2259033 RepID=A0ABW4X4R0_9ACTN
MTSTILVLPVYAAPVPEARPVEVAIDEVALGSVTEPAGEAVVATDGQSVEGGVDEAEATAPPVEPPVGKPSAEQVAADDVPGDEQVVSGEELPGVPALTYAQPDAEKFSTVGITWRQGGVTDVVVQLRVKDADGAWGEWTTLEADDIEQTPSEKTPAEEARGGTAPYWTGESYGVEVIVQGAGGVVPDDVKVALIDPGESAADAVPAESGAVDQAGAASGATMPSIISRAAWGADESIRTWGPEYAPTLKAATLHHTADRNTYSATDVYGMMRSIYAYHTRTRGWGDIGYNFIVDKFGRIFEGRYGGMTSTVIGAHAGGFNTGTFGVSMLGNYAEVDTPQALLDSVASVMAWKLRLYAITPFGSTQLTSGGGGTAKYAAGTTVTVPTVFGHRDVGNTTCPGQYAYNRMAQLRDMIGARLNAVPGSPEGNAEAIAVTGTRLDIVGWAYDPDVPTSPVDVGFSVDGQWALTMRADGHRPDVAAAFPFAGPAHGFRGQWGLSPGRHTICVVFGNAGGPGQTTWHSCKVVTATNDDAAHNPVGQAEVFTPDGRYMTVTGWSVDPDAPTSALEMHVHIDGQYAGSFPSGAPRDDIAAQYPGAGRYHGWYWRGAVAQPGNHQICIYAINRNRGTRDPLMGCSPFNVPNSLFVPTGNYEAATLQGRSVAVSGWAYDLDVPTTPTDVHVHVDGQVARILRAGDARPDVGAAYPAAGPSHGFSGSVNLAPGTHSVCVYAINLGGGYGDPGLGCRTVTVDARAWNPVGGLEMAISHSDGRVDLKGWTWDPDAGPYSTPVHFHVDGRWFGYMTSAEPRPDIAATLPPEAGPGHGFSKTIKITSGWHTICAYGINVGTGTEDPLLGCRVVYV